MKINASENSRVAFKGSFYNNKMLLSGLKYASENAAIVTAGTTLLFSTVVRPVAILLTPDTSKEDKHNACAKSIASGGLGAALTASIFAPLSKAVNKITEASEDYLNQNTIKNLKQSAKTLDESANYNFLRQLVKLSPELLSIIPKALLTAALIVPLTNFLFKKKDKTSKKIQIQAPSMPPSSAPSFKGSSVSKLTNGIAKIFDNESAQRFAQKYKDSNFIQHALNFKDVFATACFAAATCFNKKIKKENKSALIYNSALSTGLTIGGGYVVNKLLDTPVKKFTENFIEANKDDKNLFKYLNGIKIIKPILILSSLYYIFIPMISTFCADRIVKNNSKKTVASSK